MSYEAMTLTRNRMGRSIMKTRNIHLGIIALLSAWMPFTAKAQDKVEASVGVDLVSGYVWRGQDLGGVSLQPAASVAYKGFSLEAWGSTGFSKTDADGYDAKEFDLTLGYSAGGFNVSITDYWYNTGTGYFHYGAHNTAHLYEARLGYDFGPVAVNWYTNFAGADGVKENGKRAYSSYISVAAPFKLGGLDWTAEVGATPWETDFYEAGGFAVCDVSLEASKEIRITRSFSLPLFAKVTWNPCSERAYFVAGFGF